MPENLPCARAGYTSLMEDARAAHDFHVAAFGAERLCGLEDAGERIAYGPETGGNPMNACKHFLPLRLGILTLGIIAFGTPVRAVATDAHVGEMAAIAATTGTPVRAPDTSKHVDETTLTSMAVIAVDDHWSVAELRGNTAWLRSLLLPGYRSVREKGRWHALYSQLTKAEGMPQASKTRRQK